MSGMCIFGRRAGMVRLACLAVVALAMAAVCRPALAVVPSPTGFQVDISSSPRVLDALDMNRDGEISSDQYDDILYDEMCDNPHLRIRARNKPAIMLTNDAFSAAPITTFTLQINSGPYAFGTGDAGDVGFVNYVKNIAMYTDAGVSVTGSSVSADKKTLTVNFDGLTAGKKAIFNIDLDSTNANDFMYPDYRMVLFGAPLTENSPATAPGSATVLFTGPLPAPNTKTMSVTFEQETDTPAYANAHIRPYQSMDWIDVDGEGIPTPEPTSVSLALAGVAALAMRFRKGRRAA